MFPFFPKKTFLIKKNKCTFGKYVFIYQCLNIIKLKVSLRSQPFGF